MAPALIETETTHSLPLKADIPAAVKEAFNYGPKAFNRDAELNGTEEQAPASYPNYLPVWDNETTVYVRYSLGLKVGSLGLDRHPLIT